MSLYVFQVVTNRREDGIGPGKDHFLSVLLIDLKELVAIFCVPRYSTPQPTLVGGVSLGVCPCSQRILLPV